MVVEGDFVSDELTGLQLTPVDVGSHIVDTRETAFGSQTLLQINENSSDAFGWAVTRANGLPFELIANDSGFEIRDGLSLIGIVQAPWAVDSQGASVETKFSWDGSVLTQHLVYTAETIFPVYADPSLLTVVGCITGVGFATAGAIASGGAITAGDVIAIALCKAAVDADRASVAAKQRRVQVLKQEISAAQTETARLQSANAELTRMLNDPRSTASQKTYAKNQIAINNATIAGNQKLVNSNQQSINILNAEIAELSYWP